MSLNLFAMQIPEKPIKNNNITGFYIEPYPVILILKIAVKCAYKRLIQTGILLEPKGKTGIL